LQYGLCQFKGWYTHINSAQYQWYHWASTDWYQQHIHNNNMDVLVAIYQYNINTKPAKQKQVTGQIRIDTPKINNTAQVSSQHHLSGKSTTRAKVKLTTIPFN